LPSSFWFPLIAKKIDIPTDHHSADHPLTYYPFYMSKKLTNETSFRIAFKQKTKRYWMLDAGYWI